MFFVLKIYKLIIIIIIIKLLLMIIITINYILNVIILLLAAGWSKNKPVVPAISTTSVTCEVVVNTRKSITSVLAGASVNVTLAPVILYADVGC